jgi:hypothetical protein
MATRFEKDFIVGICPKCHKDVDVSVQEYSNTDYKGRPWHDRCIRELCSDWLTIGKAGK